jgi:hypothetical protein
MGTSFMIFEIVNTSVFVVAGCLTHSCRLNLAKRILSSVMICDAISTVMALMSPSVSTMILLYPQCRTWSCSASLSKSTRQSYQARLSEKIFSLLRFEPPHNINNTTRVLSCLSQKQQLFCSVFYKEVCRPFHYKDRDQKVPRTGEGNVVYSMVRTGSFYLPISEGQNCHQKR